LIGVNEEAREISFAEILAGSSWIGRSEANEALASAIGRATGRIGDDIPQADPPSSGSSASGATQRWRSGGGGT
jgi:hypothetical protein